MLQRCNINVMLCTFGVLKSYMCKIIVMEPKYKMNKYIKCVVVFVVVHLPSKFAFPEGLQ